MLTQYTKILLNVEAKQKRGLHKRGFDINAIDEHETLVNPFVWLKAKVQDWIANK